VKIQLNPCGPLQTNTIVITHKNTTIVVDPACSDLASLGILKGHLYVVLTHGHWDHILGVPLMPVETVYIHRGDVPMLSDPMLNGSLRGIFAPITVSVKPSPMCEGVHALGDISFTVYHTPGHTPGSISLYFPGEGIAIVGDFLFADGIGRTDLPGGSSAKMRMSIRKFMKAIPGDTLIYPGHGRPFHLKTHYLYKRGG